MIKNYFKIILRNLWRNKFYTFINVVGLSFGIAALVWGVQTYRYSFSFDNFHKQRNEIYRVLIKAEGADKLKGICPSSLAQFAKQDFSAVQQAVRWDSRGLDVKAEQNEPFGVDAHFTDPEFFEFFNFEFVKGKADLKNKSTVVITESAAKKYFGNLDPIGKTLLFYSSEPYKKYLTVTAVLKDPPFNSTLRFELITHFDNQLTADGSVMKHDAWGWFADAVFLKIKTPHEVRNLEKSFAKYVPIQQEARKDIKVSGFKLESITAHAIQSDMLDNNALVERPEDSAAYGVLVLAILILLSSCLNFANTSVAQSNRKLKEIAVRKVVGSSYRQIVAQQLFECGFIVLIAIAISTLLNYFWLPTFNSMFNLIKITADYVSDYTLLLILAVILIAVTLLAGGYPAFYISRFNASSIFRGSVKFGGKNFFSRVLLGFQIVISFITVIAGFAFARNTVFQKNYDFGYDRDRLIGFFVQSASDYNVLRNEISNLQGIETIAGTRQHIGFWHRTVSVEAQGDKKECNYLEVGDNYLNTVKLKLLAGRNFFTNSDADIEKSMLINENLAFQLGWRAEEAIGKQIKLDTMLLTVVGVLKDFNTGDMFGSLEPFAFSMGKPTNYSQLIIGTKPGQATKVYNEVKAAWAKLFPLKPFRGYYQNETAAVSLQTTSSIAKIFFWFAIISVLMSATGMFALVSLTVLKKTREIAIRKVVGAGAFHIYQLLAKGYVLIFFIAAAVGCYAGYALSKLLMDMIFRINAGVAVATLWVSFLCMLLITAVTVGSRAWAALQRKSADVLKGD